MTKIVWAFQSTINPGDEVLLLSLPDAKSKTGLRTARPKLFSCQPTKLVNSVSSKLSRYTTDRTERRFHYNTPPKSGPDVVFTQTKRTSLPGSARERDLIVAADEALRIWLATANTSPLRPSTHVRTHDYSVHFFKSYAMTGCGDWATRSLRNRDDWSKKDDALLFECYSQLQPNGLDLLRCNLIPQLSNTTRTSIYVVAISCFQVSMNWSSRAKIPLALSTHPDESRSVRRRQRSNRDIS